MTTILTAVGPQAIDCMAADLVMWEHEVAEAKAALDIEARNKSKTQFDDVASKYANAYRHHRDIAERATQLAITFGAWNRQEDAFLLLGKGYAIQLKDSRLKVIICADAEN